MPATFAKYADKSGEFDKGEAIILDDETGIWKKNTLKIQVISGADVAHETTDPEDAYWKAQDYVGEVKIGGEFLKALGRKRPMSVDNFYEWILKAKGGELRNKAEDMYLAATKGQMSPFEYEMRGGW
jgi:hypothetical protein